MIAALFDLDGTLCTEHVWRAFNKYFTEHRRRRLLLYVFLGVHFSLWPLHRLGLLSRARFFRLWIKHMPWLLVGLRPEEGQEIFRWVTDQALIPSLRPEMAEVYLEELLAQRDAQKAESDLLEMLRNLPSEGGE